MSEAIGLGRWYSRDDRDGKYPMSAQTQKVPAKQRRKRAHRHWNGNRWTGDQGGTSQCVVYSWAHCIERPNVPVTPWRSEGGHTLAAGSWWFAGVQPLIDLDAAYGWAQEHDEWPGTDYDGTSVRAGAKYLHKHGLIRGYTWAYDAASVAEAVSTIGPVVVGTAWTMDMFVPDEHGFITPSGAGVGGHAYLVDGVSKRNKFFRIKNSWGTSWGRNGYARISFADLELLLRHQGEACLPLFNKAGTDE